MTNDTPDPIAAIDYTTTLPGGAHWSLTMRRGTILRLRDLEGGANVGMLLHNPECLLERYNAPDTLKAQHTFRITRGHCLYSDMGRIFASVVGDTAGWHDTVCGNARSAETNAAFGPRDYQTDRNAWRQNGHDAFLVELAKYGLGVADLAANLNWFSRVTSGADGALSLAAPAPGGGAEVVLRFEMDTLVTLHTCPHPLHPPGDYPDGSVEVAIGRAVPVASDDACLNLCDENRRGFANNALYLLGGDAPPRFALDALPVGGAGASAAAPTAAPAAAPSGASA